MFNLSDGRWARLGDAHVSLRNLLAPWAHHLTHPTRAYRSAPSCTALVGMTRTWDAHAVALEHGKEAAS